LKKLFEITKDIGKSAQPTLKKYFNTEKNGPRFDASETYLTLDLLLKCFIFIS